MKEGWKRFAGIDWLRWEESQEIRLDFVAGRWDEGHPDVMAELAREPKIEYGDHS